MAGWRFFNTPLQALIRELPLRALLPLALAVFALFSVLGPVNDVINGASRPLPFLIRNGLLAGVFALGYAYGSLRGPHRIFFLTAALQIAWGLLTGGNTHVPASPLPGRLQLDGVWMLVSMVTSYSCFPSGAPRPAICV